MPSTYPQLRRSAGALGLRDQVRLWAAALYADRARRRRRAPAAAGPPALDAAAIDRLRAAARPPTSAAIAAAEALLTEVAPGWLQAHSRRTWAWAAALGEVAGARCDRELLYLAALLHDLGLTPAAAPAPGACFAVSGAEAAERFARAQGLLPQRAERLGEAIALHLEIRVAAAAGAEAHLLHAGAACDVIGQRRRELPAALVAEVLRAHPRGAMTAELTAVLGALAAAGPRTRLGIYCRRFDFLDRVRAAGARDDGSRAAEPPAGAAGAPPAAAGAART
jgi:hypothetical protein